MRMVFMMTKVLECLHVMEDVDIGLKRPVTLTTPILQFIMEIIKVVMMVDVDIGLNIPATIPPTIMDQDLMLTGEVNIGIRPSTFLPIT